MGKIMSTDEPVGRMAKLMAELYYFMAKEMTDRLGKEEGTVAVRSAINRFAEARLKSMHEEAREKMLPINVETYGKVRDMPGISWERDPDNPNDITYCPMHDMWRQLGALELGAIYCEIDFPLYRGFNAELDRPMCMTQGDRRCKFMIKQ